MKNRGRAYYPDVVPLENIRTVYKCKKAVVIHLGTNNITTDDSPKTIASKLAEVGKPIQRSTEAPRIIIYGIISRQDTRVGCKIADTNCEIKSMCVKMKWKFVNNDRPK